MALSRGSSPNQLLSTSSRREGIQSIIITDISPVSNQNDTCAFARAYCSAFCKTLFPIWLALCLMLPADTALPLEKEAFARPSLKAQARSDTLNFIARGLRGAGKFEFPYSYSSLTAAVAPHKTSPDGNEKNLSLPATVPTRNSGSSLLSKEGEAKQYTGDDEKALEGEILKLTALADEEESASKQPLEGSFGKSDAWDFYEKPFAMGPDLFSRPQDTFSAGTAFLDLEYPELMDFEDFEGLDPMSNIRDAEDQDVHEDDESYWSGSHNYPTDEEDEEENFFLTAGEQPRAKVADISQKNGFIDVKHEANDYSRDTHIMREPQALPIEYTLAKYKSVNKAPDGQGLPTAVGLSQADSKIDNNAMVPGALPLTSENKVSKAQNPTGDPFPELPTSSNAARKMEKDYVQPVTTPEPKADDEGGDPLEGRLGTEEPEESEAAARSSPADSEFPEDADELDVFTDEDEVPSHGERKAAAARHNRRLNEEVEKEDEEEESFSESEFPELNEKASALAVEETEKFKTSKTAQPSSDRSIPPEVQSPEVEGKAGIPPIKESVDFSSETTQHGAKEHALTEKTSVREVQQMGFSRPGASEATQHGPQQHEPITALLKPPSFIDWQTLGAVMTDPALKASGSPFLVPPPRYYTGAPEQTSHQGRIMVMLFASMIVLLIILLFCCCMVRKKRAHEAYMAAPMIIQ